MNREILSWVYPKIHSVWRLAVEDLSSNLPSRSSPLASSLSPLLASPRSRRMRGEGVRQKSPKSWLYHIFQNPWREQTFNRCGFCRILWATPLIHLFHPEEILLQLLAPVLTWIHHEQRRSSQPKLSPAHLLRPPFWLSSQYFTNPFYCPINQSELSSRRRNEPIRGLYSRDSFPPSSPPPYSTVSFLILPHSVLV